MSEVLQKIKKMDLEEWIHNNCKGNSAHWCLELYRRKVVLAVVAEYQEQLQKHIDEFVPFMAPKGLVDSDFLKERIGEYNDLLERLRRHLK